MQIPGILVSGCPRSVWLVAATPRAFLYQVSEKVGRLVEWIFSQGKALGETWSWLLGFPGNAAMGKKPPAPSPARTWVRHLMDPFIHPNRLDFS